MTSRQRDAIRKYCQNRDAAQSISREPLTDNGIKALDEIGSAERAIERIATLIRETGGKVDCAAQIADISDAAWTLADEMELEKDGLL